LFGFELGALKRDIVPLYTCVNGRSERKSGCKQVQQIEGIQHTYVPLILLATVVAVGERISLAKEPVGSRESVS
jgi:hypothetical protein